MNKSVLSRKVEVDVVNVVAPGDVKGGEGVDAASTRRLCCLVVVRADPVKDN